MKHPAIVDSLIEGAQPIASVKDNEDPFDNASDALRKALDALSELVLTRTTQPPAFEPPIDFYAEVRRFEIRLIRYALRKTGGSQTLAASLLCMKTTTLNSKIRAYQINRTDEQ